MKKLLFNKTGVQLTTEQMEEMMSVVETQETTDREEVGTECIFYGEYGNYEYYIDEDYDIILTKVEKA